MRFDDMMATVLAQPSDRPDRQAAQWRQLVDLLAQNRVPEGERALLHTFLRQIRGGVDLAARRETARTLADLPIGPDLVAFLAEDGPAVASPLIAKVRLDADEWISILPGLGPVARALLRHRRSLDPRVRQALGAFGAADFVLESSPAANAAGASESQIRELVERIEAYRRQKEDAPAAALPAMPATQGVEAFRWEAGSDGILYWVEGAPREPLIGQSIAVAAALGLHGVDGQAAGAFDKRAPFRDARLSVPGEGGAAGDWRMSGVPYFDPGRGSFLGYRGTARRPRLDEVAAPAATLPGGVFGTELPPDSLRQLIHELRTPLNAIVGFAELIEGQYMGPAPANYRGRAADIVGQARALLAAVDDLDTAARIETRRLDVDDAESDAAALLGRLHESYAEAAGLRGVAIALAIAPDLPPARVEAGAAERMAARLLAAAIGLAGEGERIAVALDRVDHGEAAMLRLAVSRPRVIVGLGEDALLDPGYSPEGDWPEAPALGLGFALRLVRSLATAVGGMLVVEPGRIALFLPAAIAGEEAPEQGESSA